LPPPATCVDVPDKLQRSLAALFTRKFFHRYNGVQLTTTFACDPLAQPSELVYESGSDGFSRRLTLTRVRWTGGKIEALRLPVPLRRGSR